MKILFTGGVTGGHFYPIIAVAEEIKDIINTEKLVDAKLYYMSTDPYNPRALFENDIKFIPVSAGKIRLDSSIRNIFDWFFTFIGMIQATIKLFFLYPDVVFGKGGYASFPALFAARILGIPVVIHDSDSIPGKVNLWAGKYAQKIAVSYPEALKYFPAKKTAVTGNPIRREILSPITNGAYEFLKLDPNIPVILVLGGSQGAVRINDAIIEILPRLLERYQVVHQVGKANLTDCRERTDLLLKDNPKKSNYKLFDYLDDTAMRMAAGTASLAVSRAGSTIFELANWGLPSVIIPIPESVSHDQKTNAFTYARSGGAIVVEEENLEPSVLYSEIERLMEDKKLLADMSAGAKRFANPNAGHTIAKEILNIALNHE